MEGNSGSGDNWNTWGSNFQTGRVVPADPGTNIQDLCAEECSPGNRQDTAQYLQACRLLQAHRTGGDFIYLFFFTDHCVLSGPKTAHIDSHHNSCFRLQWWCALYQCIQQCMLCGPTTFPLFILFITFCNQRNCTPCCNCNSSVMPRYSRVKCETICSTAKSWPKLNDAAGH